MINLHERLSEFSYGYGATREMESLLAAAGFRATPFLPSLLHEASLGFDVAFSGPGQVVMLQFKLGQELSRFRRNTPAESIPILQKPFWRFYTDVDEHQFLRLEEFEEQGADVFYVAPRFSSWSAYEMAFHASEVLQRSLLLRPSQIRLGAGAHGEHRIVYDRVSRYVCSEPRAIDEVPPQEAVAKVAGRVREARVPLAIQLEQLVSRYRMRDLPRLSQRREQDFRSRARTRADWMAAVIGFEAWLQGAQVLFVTPVEGQ